MFPSAALRDDNLSSLITLETGDVEEENTEGANINFDAHQLQLHMSCEVFSVAHNGNAKCRRDVKYNAPHTALFHWYDDRRGLVFCSGCLGMYVFRVTY